MLLRPDHALWFLMPLHLAGCGPSLNPNPSLGRPCGSSKPTMPAAL